MERTYKMAGQLPLNFKYKLYYTDDKKNVKNYEDRIHEIGEFASGEELVSLLSHLRPLSIQGTDYHMFKAEIRPLWEDARNRAGGKFIIRTKRGPHTMAVFTSLVLAMCGGQFGADLEAELCGVVARARTGGFSVCLWHRTSSDETVKQRLTERLNEILNTQVPLVFEHEPHDNLLSLVAGLPAAISPQ